jgi:hypothetical protein
VTDAELARSILSCPDGAEVAVDGFPAAGCDDSLGLRDEDGVVTFSCRLGSPMADAGRAGSPALVTLTSGLGPHGSPERALTLTLTGSLSPGALEHCTCCGEERLEVALELDFVVLGRGGEQHRVPLRAFRDPGTTGTPAEHLLDVSLVDLTTHGAELSWIDRHGGHRASLWFSRPAASVEELGVLLRHELHAGIC